VKKKNNEILTNAKGILITCINIGIIIIIILSALKLFGIISLGWIWIFSPLWIPVAFIIQITLIVMIAATFFVLLAMKIAGKNIKDL